MNKKERAEYNAEYQKNHRKEIAKQKAEWRKAHKKELLESQINREILAFKNEIKYKEVK